MGIDTQSPKNKAFSFQDQYYSYQLICDLYLIEAQKTHILPGNPIMGHDLLLSSPALLRCLWMT